MNIRDKEKTWASIQYLGKEGTSLDCVEAVERLISYGDRICEANILSYGDRHCLLLIIDETDYVAIKSGFASGYPGEGPRSFSYVLCLLEAVGAVTWEHQVGPEVIERVNNAALTKKDFNLITSKKNSLPPNFSHYIQEEHRNELFAGHILQRLKASVPLGIIDERLIDLALRFREDPDQCLLIGYRRLEDAIRTRSQLDEHGTRLFTRAFDEKLGPLGWKEVSSAERSGRVELFTGAFKAHRNPRAHREERVKGVAPLAEFLLLNHLYLLEKTAIRVDRELD